MVGCGLSLAGGAPRADALSSRALAAAEAHRGTGRVVHACGYERRVYLRGGSAWDIPGALLLEAKLRKAQVHDRASLKAPPGLSQLDRIPELTPAHKTGREPVESTVKHADNRADERLFRHEAPPRRNGIPRLGVKALRASSWRREAFSLEEVCQTQALHTSATGASVACRPREASRRGHVFSCRYTLHTVLAARADCRLWGILSGHGCRMTCPHG